MDFFNEEYDDETFKKQMATYAKMSADFANEHKVSCIRMLSLHLSLFVMGCAVLNMKDETFKNLIVEAAKNFKDMKKQMDDYE
jgi:hypothetical protein